MMTTPPPALPAAKAAEAPACIIGALPPSMAAAIRVLPPTRISSTSSPSVAKYPASLAIQVVAQLAAKLGYKSCIEIVAVWPSDWNGDEQDQKREQVNLSEKHFISSDHRTEICLRIGVNRLAVTHRS